MHHDVNTNNVRVSEIGKRKRKVDEKKFFQLGFHPDQGEKTNFLDLTDKKFLSSESCLLVRLMDNPEEDRFLVVRMVVSFLLSVALRYVLKVVLNLEFDESTMRNILLGVSISVLPQYSMFTKILMILAFGLLINILLGLV